MTNATKATVNEKELALEIESIREGGDFPVDMDWEAEYQVEVRQQPAGREQIKGDWLYGLEHKYNGLEAVLTENPETIYDNTPQESLVAYKFDCEYRDEQTVVIGYMYPAIQNISGEYHITDSKELAKAEIRPTMKSCRSQALISAYMETNHVMAQTEAETEETNELTSTGKIPENLDWDLTFEAFLEVKEAEQHDYPHPDWIDLITDQEGRPTGMRAEQEDICMEVFGALHAVKLTYQIDSRGFVMVTGNVHPATLDSMDWEVNEDITYATARIVIQAKNPRTAAAMRQYVRQMYE